MKMKMKKTSPELYQDGGIEGMKGLKLPDETEIKDELKTKFLIFLINIKSFLSILLIKKKKILTTKYVHLKLMILIFMINYNTL